VQGGTDDLGVLPAGPGRLVTGELPDPGDHRCHPAGLDAQPLGDHPVLHRGVAGGGKHQAAFRRHSSTRMKPVTVVTVTSRAAARAMTWPSWTTASRRRIDTM
jgi:hypothetical protein